MHYKIIKKETDGDALDQMNNEENAAVDEEKTKDTKEDDDMKTDNNMLDEGGQTQ